MTRTKLLATLIIALSFTIAQSTPQVADALKVIPRTGRINPSRSFTWPKNGEIVEVPYDFGDKKSFSKLSEDIAAASNVLVFSRRAESFDSNFARRTRE